jgi:hypothetical protein
MDDNEVSIRLFKKDEEGFERIVFAEVIIPDALNSHGDLHTRESVKEFAYSFMLNKFGVDVDHDEEDVSDSLTVVESFIVRDGDPDFIPGAWVVGMYIGDDEVWQAIRNGELNGYSYQAWVEALPIDVTVQADVTRFGTTQPDLEDGHTHEFFAMLDTEGYLIAGGTTETNGHSHMIRRHTFTEKEAGHSHIFNIVKGVGGI